MDKSFYKEKHFSNFLKKLIREKYFAQEWDLAERYSKKSFFNWKTCSVIKSFRCLTARQVKKLIFGEKTFIQNCSTAATYSPIHAS